MKKTLMLVAAAALVLGFSARAMALNDDTDHDVTITVDEVAMIADVGADVSFVIEAPAQAGGDFVVAPTNEDGRWLQYSSIVDNAGETRTITVQISGAVNPPAGTTLSVSAADPAGDGCGTLGNGVADVDLTGVAQDMVTGIGSGTTGTGVGVDGVQLTYELTIDDCSALFADVYTVNILYTLTDSTP